MVSGIRAARVEDGWVGARVSSATSKPNGTCRLAKYRDVWSDPILLALFRRFPARDSIFKASEGRAETEYERDSATLFFQTFGKDLKEVADKDVLDLGSGFGSQAVQYASAGAASVVGVEVEDDKVTHSRKFAEKMGVVDRVSFVVGWGEELPLPAGSFDLITMDEVLEHVISPAAVLQECYRVLRPGGVLYAKFPPYYCVHGGSHFHGYLTRVPGLNLLFSTRALKSAATIRLDEMRVPWHQYLRDEPTDKLWNLNGLTIRGLRRILRRLPFKCRIQYLGFRDRLTSRHRTNNRMQMRGGHPAPFYWAFEWAAQAPFLQEIACSRVTLEAIKIA